MAIETFKSELEYFIRARYSIIYLHTSEEERAIDLVKEIGAKLKKRVITWSVITGLKLDGEYLDIKSTSFKKAIEMAEKLAKEPTLFIWYDLHTLFDTVNTRSFREFSQKIRSGLPSNSIIISPTMTIPIELQKDITLIDLPLPDRNEVKEIVLNFTSQYKSVNGITIDTSEETLDALTHAAVGLTQTEVENCLAKSLVKNREISQNNVHDILEEKKQIIRKSGIVEYISTDSMDSSKIGGLQNLKRWLNIRQAAFTQEAHDFGIQWPKGVLLAGVPGCGKSLSAKCVAASWQMPLLRLDVGRVFSSYVGSSEANIRRALALCETISPAIVWIDEIEKALGGSRNGELDGGTSNRVFATLLTWMQEKNSPVFVFATANRIESIPPELLRKGRFDEIFFVDLPNEDERAEIFKVNLERIGRDVNQFDMRKLVEVSGESKWGSGIRLTGSEIEAAVNEGLVEAFSRRSQDGRYSRDLETSDIVKAIERSVPLAKVRHEQIEHMRTWANEHAVRASLPSGSSSQSNMKVEVTEGRNIDF